MPDYQDLDEIQKKALRYLKKRDFSTLSYFLTAKVPLFGNHAELYYYLGLAQYYLKNFKSAEDYFKSGMEYDTEHVEIRLAAAATALRQRNNGQAVHLWLNVLDIDPDNKKARKGLNLLRKKGNPTDLARFIRKGSIKQLEPTLPSYITLFDIMLILLGCILVSGTIFLGIKLSENFFMPNASLPSGKANRAGAEAYTLSSVKKKDYIQKEGEFLIQLTPKEIHEIITQAKNDFNNYKDNKVRFNLNRIKYSNAAAAVKAQASVLFATLEKPNFTNLDTNYTYREVFSDPIMYTDVYVHWRGKVQDVQFTPEAITFRLLVGYDDEKVLEGAVPVKVPFETFIDPILPTEILGQVKIDDENHVYILASSIHQILKPSP